MSDDRPWPLKDAVTQKVTYADMMSDFEGRGIDDSFIRLLSKAKPIRWGFFHHRSTSTYYRGRVVLVGDSAHASLPFQAAGAAQGLEDAVILSNLLADVAAASEKGVNLNQCVHAAFEGYDSVRRPRAEKQLIQAAEVSDMIYFQHPKAGSDMSKILPRLQQGRFDWLWFHNLDLDLQSALRRLREVLNENSHAHLH